MKTEINYLQKGLARLKDQRDRAKAELDSRDRYTRKLVGKLVKGELMTSAGCSRFENDMAMARRNGHLAGYAGTSRGYVETRIHLLDQVIFKYEEHLDLGWGYPGEQALALLACVKVLLEFADMASVKILTESAGDEWQWQSLARYFKEEAELFTEQAKELVGDLIYQVTGKPEEVEA